MDSQHENKPGVKTTEFWITIITGLLPVLVISGVLSPEQAETTQDNINQLALSISSIIAAVIVLWRYIESRTKIKGG